MSVSEVRKARPALPGAKAKGSGEPPDKKKRRKYEKVLDVILFESVFCRL